MDDLDHALARLADALGPDNSSWLPPCLVGEDQSDKLATLTSDLRGAKSNGGRGKIITSGFSYWGPGPTMAWIKACRDPYYLTMRESFRSFEKSLRTILPALKQKQNYVSLGPGNGQKDRMILRQLEVSAGRNLYMPIDISAEMLHVAVQEVMTATSFPSGHILPIQIDFSLLENVRDLDRLLNRIVGSSSILFSFLGNTVSNFEDDAEVLYKLSLLMRPQDRLLLEVATSEEADDEAAARAAEEYARSRAFREFTVSSLFHNTDLRINMDYLTFTGSVEHDRAIVVRTIYENQTSDDRMRLPDGSRVNFPTGDNVELGTMRKYTPRGYESLLTSCRLREVAHAESHPPQMLRASAGFGIRLSLLESLNAGSKRISQMDLAEDVWANFRHY
jgi:L-histidine N-alpha-methyltransferase